MRPLGTLPQIMVSDIRLRRIGRIIGAVAVMVYALMHVDVGWTPAKVALTVATPVAGAVIFSAIWVVTCSVCFWVVEGREFANAVTYGSNAFTSYPINVYSAAAALADGVHRAGRVRRVLPEPRAAREAGSARTCRAGSVGHHRSSRRWRRRLPGSCGGSRSGTTGERDHDRGQGAPQGVQGRHVERLAAQLQDRHRGGRGHVRRQGRARPSGTSGRTVRASPRRSRC